MIQPGSARHIALAALVDAGPDGLPLEKVGVGAAIWFQLMGHARISDPSAGEHQRVWATPAGAKVVREIARWPA